ncbi:MAG: TIGR03560 family F420-dependent LLM class oxidoreductase [Actinobacteria bacterium]|nr:TIGR03560 family F420-dependent LLM class oxidoreductase [Actinomycetota bacterium]
MRVCLMIEGQEGVTWDEWVALGRATEESGLEGLFRSDHYAGLMGDETRGSLDAWTQIAALGAITSRIRLGTLVSPITFRHPALLAKAVATADHVSGGRVELGIGAGWNVREHDAYGFRFPELAERLERLEEQLELIVRQWTEDRVTHDGRHYRLEALDARPKPVQRPRPPLIVGGAAKPRTARLAARLADEYNTPFASLEQCRERRARIVEACAEVGRDPLVFSLMSGCVVATDRSEFRDRIRRLMERMRVKGDPDDFVRERGGEMILGTVDEVVRRLQELESVGVERVFLQHLAHDDLEMVRLLGAEVAPAVASG